MPVTRRLLIRVLGAPLLLAALGGILYWGHVLHSQGRPNTPVRVLILLAAVLSAREIFQMCAAKGIATAPWAGGLAVGATFLPWSQWFPATGGEAPEAIRSGLALYLLIVMVLRFGRLSPEGAALTYLAFGYLSLLSYAVDLPGPLAGNQTYYLLFLVAAGKGSDMAAFVVGKSFGRHRMAPVVSPNKTWEGAVGGGLAGTAAGFAVLRESPLHGAYPGIPVPALLFFCLMVTIAAQVGDLVKSAFKRWAGVKDSGRLLPEFGGMLDMVDSFIIAAPVATLGTRILGHLF
jgi:phosphatidate cytidylyltransferase